MEHTRNNVIGGTKQPPKYDNLLASMASLAFSLTASATYPQLATVIIKLMIRKYILSFLFSKK